jgi:Domain of unknown function (DUF4365)
MTMLTRKTRTREHVIADLSINHVERQLLLCGCTVQRMHLDYGYDLITTSFNAQGEVEPGIVYFQVKATDNLPLLADGKTISWVVSRRDLLLWLTDRSPVILVVYDARRDRGYWLDIQGYFGPHPQADMFVEGQTINIHLPVTNRLNRRSVRRIIQAKNAIYPRLQWRGPPDA